MSFLNALVLAIALSLATHGYLIANPDASGILIVFNAGCLLVLAWTAINNHRNRKPGFDVIVATECIVAFGIMSLILSLVVGLAPFFLGTVPPKLDASSLRIAAVPFLEGLTTAGVAPLAAMVVRVLAIRADAVINPVGDVTDLSKAIASLTGEISEAHRAVTELRGSLGLAVTSTKEFAEGVATETAHWKFAVSEGQAEVRAFAEANKTAREHVNELADSTDRLRASAEETGTMLDALTRLIESVQRFVKPGTRARA